MISPIWLIAAALNRFGRDRGHLVTCNRLLRLAARLGGLRPIAQSYAGKHPISKGIERVILWFAMVTLAQFSRTLAAKEDADDA
jgi:hypothetical protein